MATLVVVPTYNERQNVRSLIPLILALPGALQVLVVDDASPDGTAAEVVSAAKRHRGRLHLLVRNAKLGLGSAYVQGFQWALQRGFQSVIQMDADHSHDPAAIPEFLKGLKAADVVVGTRYKDGRVSVVHWPLRRLALSRAANWYVRVVTGLPLSDSTGGFKAWNSQVLGAIHLETVRSDGYSFQVEMNHRAWKQGYKLTELPIIFNDRTSGSSKMSPAIIREAIWRVWSLRFGF